MRVTLLLLIFITSLANGAEKPITWKDQLVGCVVRQQFDFSCGTASLATLIKHEFGNAAINEIDMLIPLMTLVDTEAKDRMHILADAQRVCGKEVSFTGESRGIVLRDGASLLQLWCLARLHGYDAFLRTTDLNFLLTKIDRPLIVHLVVGKGLKHFAVLRKISKTGWVYLADPTRGCKVYRIEEFVQEWQRKEVLILHKEGYVPFTGALAVQERNIVQQRRDAVRGFFRNP